MKVIRPSCFHEYPFFGSRPQIAVSLARDWDQGRRHRVRPPDAADGVEAVIIMRLKRASRNPAIRLP